MEKSQGMGAPTRETGGFWLKPCAMAFAVALALGLSGCGGGGGANVRPAPPAPPPTGSTGFTGGEIVVGSNDVTVLSDDIGGSIDLIKGGTGTLMLTGTDTYTGGTTIKLGTLQIGNGGTTGSIIGDVTDNASLVFDRSDSVIFSGIVSGSGSLGQAGTGSLTLTGANTYSGGTTISRGTLQLGNGGTSGSITGDVTNNASLVFHRSDAVNFDGIVSGSGSLLQAGTGSLILTGANTYTGGTTISNGTLQLGNSGTTGSITGDVTNNASLVFHRSDAVNFDGIVSGSGSLLQVGTGSLILTGANTYTGGTTISNGTLQLGNSGTIGSITGDVTNNATLVFDRSDDVTFNGLVSGSGSLKQAGTGSLILTGANTYTGNTSISSGMLQLGNGGTTGSISGDVIDNGALVFNRSDDVTFNGIVSGSGSLNQAGAGKLTLTGANTYAGGTTIGSGTLQIGNGGTTGSINGDVTNNGNLVFDRSDTVIFNGIVSGAGSLEQAGTGTLILTGASTNTGVNLVSSGTMEIAAGGTPGTGNIDVDNTAGQNAALKVDRDASIGNRVFLRNAATLDNSGTMTGSLGDVVEGAYIADSNAQATVFNRAGGIIKGLGNQTVALMMRGNASITNQGYIGGNATATILGGGGAVDNDGGTIETLSNFYDYTITTFYGATVTNRAGGKIISTGSGAIDALHMNGGGMVYNDGPGSSITADLTAVYIETAPGLVKNSNGASIVGQLGAVHLQYSGEVDNDGKDSVIGSTLPSSATIYIGGGGSSTVRNTNGATIYNEGEDGRAVMAPADIFNDNSTISATGIGSLGIQLSGPGLEVVNSNGASITGQRVGIFLYRGGTIINGGGSVIQTTGAATGSCYQTGSCAIFEAGPSDDPVYGRDFGGALILHNAGSIIGNVQMDPAAANTIELTAGGFIQGELSIGTNTQSTLTLSGDNATPQLYSHAVTGTTTFAGSLIKDGGGTWVIDNSDLQSVVDTSVNSGFLQATQMLWGNVTVNASGNLDAVPGVVGNLTNAGKVAIHGGDSTVSGTYTQLSTGSLAVSLGSKLDVAGSATLNGGTLEVTGADSGYVSNTHTNVLTAAGGVTGTFDQLVKDTGVVFTATTINYDANSVWLDTTGLNVTTAAAGQGVSYTPASFGSAQRVQGAFEQLDDKIAAGTLSDVSGDFLRAAGQFQQSPSLLAAQASLQSLSGQLHAASAAMTFKAIDASSRALSDRFDNLLDKGTGFGMWMHDLSIGGDMARAGFDGVGFQLNGWLVGSDRPIGHSGVAGYAFGQSRGQQRLNQSFDHDNSRSTEGMMYAGWLNGNWYTQGRVGFGHVEQDVSRQILLGDSVQGVQTRYTGNYNMAYGESGLHLGRGDSHVTPFVNVQYARIDRGGFAEQGAGGFGLRSNAQTLDRWQAGLGVRAGRHWNLDSGRAVDLNARVQWQRTLASHGDVFDASFVGLQQWQPLVGIGLSRYSGLLGVGLDATLSAHATLKFGYDYEMGQRDHAQMLSARLNVAF
jgi:autotransporter-associated beta strand protein